MKCVIIGSGVAGMTAALDLAKAEGVEVELYTDEAHSYYYRPQVTNFLAGVMPLERVFLHPLPWYEERGVHMHLASPVVRLEPDQKRIILEDGTAVTYDKLLLTTGSCPFVPPIEGVEKAGVFTIRTLADALTIKDFAPHCTQGLVVGGGLLGLEAARALKGMGLEVTIVEFMPRLMPMQLDTEGAAILQGFVEAQGYHVFLGTAAKTVLGDGKVESVLLSNGETVPAQIMVVAAGVRPNSRLAQEAGLTIDRGILVDEWMRTSAPDVYAAGDVARFQGICWAIVPTAQAQARIAVANILGQEARYENLAPATALKVAGIDVNSMGVINPPDASCAVFQYTAADTSVYRKITLRQEGSDSVIVGAITINDKLLAKKLSALIEQRASMTPEEAQSLVEG
ncbi:MAG: FAD-dependent oxidoreductase [Anaerolineae bacterium]|jgi:nitrite reductase (NADH) large subunit|nr:FAD-dependent oxidoreductase [Anaerolineae bacterium]